MRLGLTRLSEIAQVCHNAARRYDSSYLAVLLRVIRLFCKEGLGPGETFLLGLADPRIPTRELSGYASKRELRKVQTRLNPTSLGWLTVDKSLFYPYCASLSIPIPQLYAVFEPVGWLSNGSVLSTRESWETFFRDHLPQEFIIKPAKGTYGRGFNVFNRCDQGFADPSGKVLTASGLYDVMCSDTRYSRFIIQERLKNHPELERLSGTEFLQCVRIITLISRETKPLVPYAHLKVITGPNITDNFHFGQTGNINAIVSLNEGLLKSAFMVGTDGLKKDVYSHLKTGVPFEAFRLPFWKEACSLVQETALKFLPIRTIGWDVALTPTGPVIMEGNMWFDPPTIPFMKDFLKAC